MFTDFGDEVDNMIYRLHSSAPPPQKKSGRLLKNIRFG